MKTLLIILIPLFSFSQLKWTDYDTHYHVSGNLELGFSSIIYAKTERNLLSHLLASGIVSGIGLGKEFIYDGLLKLGTKDGKDMDGNVRGIIIYGGVSMCIVHGVEKKKIEYENYQNLNLL